MRVGDLHMLVDYHYWARDRMFEALALLTTEQFTQHVSNSFPSVRDTVVHLYTADWGWLLLWQGEKLPPPTPPEGFPDLASIQAAWREQERKVRGFMETLEEGAVSAFWPTLLHLINHGSYHRGQVTTLLWQLGVKPPKSQDMIIFQRERATALVS